MEGFFVCTLALLVVVSIIKGVSALNCEGGGSKSPNKPTTLPPRPPLPKGQGVGPKTKKKKQADWGKDEQRDTSDDIDIDMD